MTIPMMAATMSEEQQAVFYAQLGAAEKDEVVGVLLALFLGSFGLHHFYLNRKGQGIAYLLFFWTGIPALLGLIECFFMPGRVAQYNMQQAMLLTASIRGVSPQLLAQPATGRPCPSCGTQSPTGVRFCGKCGATLY